MRGLFVAVLFFTMTPLLIFVQWLLRRLGAPCWSAIGVRYYLALCAVLRIRVHVVGNPVLDRAVLFISKHMSWADIVSIGSILPFAYVSKSEIAKWPLVGTAAKSQRTVFVDRSRRQQTGDAISEIVERLASGASALLFAGRYIERHQPRAVVPLSFGRRREGGKRARSARHRHPTDVDLLYGA